MTSATRTAIIAGVGPGIGAATARAFANAGYHVALLARNEDYLSGLKADIERSGAKASAFPVDLTKSDTIHAAMTSLIATLPPIHVLVCNAGAAFRPGSILNLDPKALEQSLNVQVLGPLHLTQLVLPEMLLHGEGSIIYTGATASLRAGANFASLAVPKFALRALAQSVAREFNPKNIHVSHVIIDAVVESDQGRQWKRDAPDDALIKPDAIAAEFLHLTRQQKSAWTFELELRPFLEQWS
ncbi:Aste57867_14383 [Aphanomyces stellatus]|uniref:Aste57867_14383 protein n=1 Tax=Aphanomyces stellatus TaxID=120398 RepID=A0A485L0U6_9STRA|nr:hypothetical protein As57867_014329 [Aphanomyces stellatus]VFT91206.1 Aste57867_14383 [Aphanomyces stellatus]